MKNSLPVFKPIYKKQKPNAISKSLRLKLIHPVPFLQRRVFDKIQAALRINARRRDLAPSVISKHITQSFFKNIDELGDFFDLEGAAFGDMLVVISERMPGCLGKLS